MSLDEGKVSRRAVLKVGAGVAAHVCLLTGCSERDVPIASFSFGVITDVQYADADPVGPRIYRGAPAKLKAAIEHLNTMNLDFVIHLGDLIDHDFFSFSTMMPLIKTIKAPVAMVLGNHEYEVDDDKKTQVPAELGMSARYYDFVMGNWRFVVLDTNDVSLYANTEGSDAYTEATAILNRLKALNQANAKVWNSAISSEQIDWLNSRLAMAESAHQKVIVFGHSQVYPDGDLRLWNAQEIMTVLDSHDCVAAYLNGHNHDGAYGVYNGTHYVTFRGMLDGEDRTSYAVVRCDPDAIRITGYGDEPTRILA
ncbi:MAG: metallophosphoesterase [Phycisphaerae bacterium]|nr:metallophosphoesterase [Phycisphaerae bacterium]